MAGEISIQVTGAEKLEALAKTLKEIGDKELRKELYRGIERAVKPIKQAVRASALETLPKRGGLNQRVAKAKITTKKRTAGRDVGVSIVAGGKMDARSIDAGRVRHPVFGNRRVWVNQSVTPGWFTNAAEEAAPAARTELLAVLDDIADRIRRG